MIKLTKIPSPTVRTFSAFRIDCEEQLFETSETGAEVVRAELRKDQYVWTDSLAAEIDMSNASSGRRLAIRAAKIM